MDEDKERERLSKDWTIDFGKKLIHRKPVNLIRKLRDKIVRPKYPVIALYRFARYHEDSAIGIAYPGIVDRDFLPKIEDIPTRFVLNKPWSIPKKGFENIIFRPTYARKQNSGTNST